MVMHARKTQRMNDGYFEKHQTHPYQVMPSSARTLAGHHHQNSKYSSSKGSYGSSGERYERIRDSPNGNSYRSDSPDSQSPRDRDRAYQSKGSYLQKIREKERENRDYKMSRDKYSDCARSPKDKRVRESRDSEHRTNHDRSSDDKMLLKMTSQNSSRDRKPMHNCQDKRDDRERLTRVGDWSEHISSSGKKYYYNCKTEVSQWEKPREWVEREARDRERFRGKERDGPSSDTRAYGRSSVALPAAATTAHDKHSNSRSSKRHWRDDLDSQHHDPRRKHLSDGDVQSTQDMDISPGDSTPTSEVSYVHTPSSSREQPAVGPGLHVAVTDEPSPVLLATALPRLQQQPTPQQAVVLSPVAVVATADTAPTMVPPPNAAVTTCNTPGPPPTAPALPRLLSQMAGATPTASSPDHKVLPPALLLGARAVPDAPPAGPPDHTVTVTAGDGPPTPTHSESQDCVDPRKQVVVTAGAVPVAVASPPGTVLGTVAAATPCTLSSLQHVAACGTSSLSALRPQGPSITPSLANYYRDDLVNHVRGWPADLLEKQAQKLSDEAHITGSLQCTKVSAELKTARSIVRLTEIQATLQEQRVLFLRQQIKMLEDMKSQNSFMSDDL